MNRNGVRLINNWSAAWENVPSDMCAQRRLRLACAFAQSDQNLRSAHEETLHPWLSKNHQWRFWSDCAFAQADLNLRWARMYGGKFSDVAAHLMSGERAMSYAAAIWYIWLILKKLLYNLFSEFHWYISDEKCPFVISEQHRSSLVSTSSVFWYIQQNLIIM